MCIKKNQKTHVHRSCNVVTHRVIQDETNNTVDGRNPAPVEMYKQLHPFISWMARDPLKSWGFRFCKLMRSSESHQSVGGRSWFWSVRIFQHLGLEHTLRYPPTNSWCLGFSESIGGDFGDASGMLQVCVGLLLELMVQKSGIRRENHLGCTKPCTYDKLPINW